uniref:Uncharacterized protein n=1 Tax=Cyclophora tenuis TaxID=216820 RepID=A0A7S1CZU9_CYCTE
MAVAFKRPSALVTGSTDGIGVTTAKNLAAKGYNVIVHGRDEDRIRSACQTVRNFARDWTEGDGISVYSVKADLSTIDGTESLASQVKSLCREHNLNLSVLMNNAGVYSEDRVITPDGLELTFAVNVVSPFILTSRLLPVLMQQPKSRIVTASSISQSRFIGNWNDLDYTKRPYSAHAAYSESKLFDAMLTAEFAERLQKAGLGTDRITCNCLDPGTVNTKMLYAGWGPIGIDVESALDQTWLCTDEEVENTTGKYFMSRTESWSQYDEKQRLRMWDLLSKLSPDSAAQWELDVLTCTSVEATR